MRPVPRRTWLTVGIETPASLATVLSVGLSVMIASPSDTTIRQYLNQGLAMFKDFQNKMIIDTRYIVISLLSMGRGDSP